MNIKKEIKESNIITGIGLGIGIGIGETIGSKLNDLANKALEIVKKQTDKFIDEGTQNV
jgi:hypothetical protein